MTDTAAKQATVAASATRNRSQARPAHTPGAGSPMLSMAMLSSNNGNRAVSGLLSGGMTLPADIRAEMESRFGESFADVRIHDDLPAHASAAQLHAKAYTHGRDIVFSANRFSPRAVPGKRLLAHELAHVVQQRRGGAAPLLDANASHEHGADAAADAVVAGQSNIAVAGATGVGVARDEEEGWGAKLRRKVREAKEAIPEEYHAKIEKAADIAADKAVDLMVMPFGAAGAIGADGLGSAMLHDAKKAAAGDPTAGEGMKGFIRDKTLEGIGVAKGVVTQVTEVVDTAMWVGGEYGKLRDEAAERLGGEKGSPGHTAVKAIIDGAASVLPGTSSLVMASNAHDLAKGVGLVDKKTGQASITAPMAEKTNEAAGWVEEQVGGKSSDPFLFTPLERGELEGAIGTQVALSATGATEAKVAVGAIGFLGSLRTVVETVRNDREGFYKQPAFWSGLLTGVLSVVGLANLRAGKKIIDIAIQGGTVLGVVPHVIQLYNDYYSEELAKGDPKKRHEVLVQDWQNLSRALADVLLLIAHAGAAGKPPPKGKGAPPEATAKGAAPEPAVKPVTSTEPAAAPKGSAAPEPGTSAAAPPAGPAPAKAAPPKPASAKALKRAGKKAAAEQKAAAKQKKRANDFETKAKQAVERAKKAAAKAEEQRATAERLKDLHGEKAAHAEAKKASPPKTREKAQTLAANAKKRMEAAQALAKKTDAAAQKAASSAGRSSDAAKAAHLKAAKAESKAAAAKAKADALKPPIDPQTIFDPGDPAFAPAPDAPLPVNKEPVVWVNHGTGKSRGTYVPEGSPGFGKGEGMVKPLSQATSEGYRPAGTPAEPVPITPREVGGRQVESSGAGGEKGGKFISATARESSAVETTSIRPDLSEAGSYGHHLDHGEFGILRPQGSNAPGVDSITAQVQFDGKGRPVRAKIYLNDATTPGGVKGAKASHAEWRATLERELDPNAPPGRRMDFGNPALEAVIRQAARNGDVYIRVVRVEPTAAGKLSVRINPRETWRLGPLNLPLLRPMVAPPEAGEPREPDTGKAAP